MALTARASWSRSLEALHRELSSEREGPSCPSPPCPPRPCLVSMLHVPKTGGVSVREWMLRLESKRMGQYLGPVTWMKHRGRFCSHGKYLHCCHPLDGRPATSCRKVRLTDARAEAIRLLTGGGEMMNNSSQRRLFTDLNMAPTRWRSDLLTLLEFHWPDSALGPWGEPHTFLNMFPSMRPHRLPMGCRVVVTTLLRHPMYLYPSLQLHQFPAMRGYNERSRTLDSCDYEGFVSAFPNFQAWRITSSEWSPLPVEVVSHNMMFSAASRLLRRFDLVGVTERMDSWLLLLCTRVGIVPCPNMKHLNQARRSRNGWMTTTRCPTPNQSLVERAVKVYALADLRLHEWVSSRLEDEAAKHHAGLH